MDGTAFKMRSGVTRNLVLRLPPGEVRGKILILHGMAEHYGRYGELAEALARAGYASAGYDQAGHGHAAPRLGDFGPGGWEALLHDAAAAAAALELLVPGKPFALLGHSMGSFVAREYALRHAGELDALVLSGTGWYPAAVCAAGSLAARAASCCGRGAKPSPMMNALVFSRNNRRVPGRRTAFDWLSRDAARVDAYIKDPLCGFPLTGDAYRAFFAGLRELARPGRLGALPKDLPVLFFSGGEDPVGGRGRGVKRVVRQFADAGLGRTALRLYPGGRHEMLNELNRDQVTADLIGWLDGALDAGKGKDDA